MSKTHLTLFGGHKIPLVGYGSISVKHGGEGEEGLEKGLDMALEAGYRLIDTALVYNNEHIVGRVLKRWFESGKLKREDVFVTTKLPGCQPPDRVEEILKESLEKLQLDYVDLYLIHYPMCTKYISGVSPLTTEAIPSDIVATWKALEKQVDLGRAKEIGISNYNINQVKRVLENCRIKPAVNQVELHVYCQQKELVKFCQGNGVVIESHQSLSKPGVNNYLRDKNLPVLFATHDLLNDPVVKKIAAKHGKNPSHVLLRFLNQKEIIVIPNSLNSERIKANLNLYDFTLDAADIKELEDLDQGEDGRCSYLDFNDRWVKHNEYPYDYSRKQDKNKTSINNI